MFKAYRLLLGFNKTTIQYFGEFEHENQAKRRLDFLPRLRCICDYVVIDSEKTNINDYVLDLNEKENKKKLHC